MGYRINTNIAAMNAHSQGLMTNRELSSSLEKLSSGLRINKAADDASGMAIADSLRNQANSLGQAIRNANDAIGIIQTADKAMDEQVKILDTIKTKATQAAQDGQTTDTRKALQADITRLLEELDNIANTTSFNGQNLLGGSYTNKKFQIGAYANETIKASIQSTHSSKVGDVRFETSNVISGAVTSTLTFSAVDGQNDLTLESVEIGTTVGTGVGALADTINKNSDALGGIKASWTNVTTASAAAVVAGDVVSVVINGVNVGTISGITANDSDGKLVNAINDVKSQTGVEAYIDERGYLNLRSTDGRGINISGTGVDTIMGFGATTEASYGRLTLTRSGGKDIVVTSNTALGGFSATGGGAKETIMNLGDVKGTIGSATADAIGAFENSSVGDIGTLGAGVTTLAGAMAVMSIADAAIKQLDKVRSDLGSVQNQLTATVNNISVTQVNVKASESQIRDVDFASESANFQKYNILAQSGSYALSQANQSQQNVMKLLQ